MYEYMLRLKGCRVIMNPAMKKQTRYCVLTFTLSRVEHRPIILNAVCTQYILVPRRMIKQFKVLSSNRMMITTIQELKMLSSSYFLLKNLLIIIARTAKFTIQKKNSAIFIVGILLGTSIFGLMPFGADQLNIINCWKLG